MTRPAQIHHDAMRFLTMFRTKPAIVEIDPAEAAVWATEERLTLVDVREVDERRAIAPAAPSTHIPLGTLAARLHELPRDQPIAFICAAGGRSAMAAKTALKAGLDARNVTGGMNAWTASATPTTTGRPGEATR